MIENNSSLQDFFNVFQKLKKVTHTQKNMPFKQSDMMVLHYLHKHVTDEQGMKVSEIGKLLELAPPTVTAIINSLEEKNYIIRSYNKQDRRNVYVSLTEDGVRAAEEATQFFIKKMQGCMDYIGEEDTKELLRITNKIIEYVSLNKEDMNA